MEPKSDLQLLLVKQVLQRIVNGELEGGAPLRETALSQQFGVSRTPLRHALAQLTRLGAAGPGEGRGLVVTASATAAAAMLETLPLGDEETIKESIARDWFEGRIPKEVSESFFRNRYNLGKMTLSRVLSQLSEEGVISRMAGYGWQFEPTLNSQQAHDASYEFRLLIEPSALLLPSFQFDPAEAQVIRKQHERMLKERDPSVSDLFRLDENFHSFTAKCSANQFVISAVAQQNRLRRLMEYQSILASGRLQDSCREHLDILAALETGEHAIAAEAMRRHLVHAQSSPPEFIGLPASVTRVRD